MQVPGIVTVTVGAIRVSVTVSDFTSIEVVIADDDMMVDDKVVDTGDDKMVGTGDGIVVDTDDDKMVGTGDGIVVDKDVDVTTMEKK